MKPITKILTYSINTCTASNSHSICECPGINQPRGDIWSQSCESIELARVLASSLIDKPGKVATYRDASKQFWLKDLSKEDIQQPLVDSTCTMFYFNDDRRKILEQEGVDQRFGDISSQSCASIDVARVLARLLVDGPKKAAAYRDDTKKFYLKDLSREDVKQPTEKSSCTMFYFNTSERAILEYPKIDQPYGDISSRPCPSIAVARVLAHLLLDSPRKAAAYRDDAKRFFLKDLSKADIQPPCAMSACTMFYYT